MAKRKKRKLKPTGIIILLILALAIAFGLKASYAYLNKHILKPDTNIKNDKIHDANESTDNSEKEIKGPKTYKLSLLATGDGLIHNVIFKRYKTADGYDFSPAVQYVKDIVSKYDIAYYNQETVFGGENLGISGYPLFNTPSEYGDAMLNIGFNMVSLASNHSLDKGETGILNSLKYWKSTDVLYNGFAESSEDRQNNIIIKEKNNIKYTMLSYTEMTNGLQVPSGKDYLVNVYDPEKVKEDILAVRDKVDVLIVAMHWGVEYQSEPNAKQKEIAQYLADLGVDIIIGNHPHVLQPITWVDNTLVMYSLGNFISNQYGTDDYNKLVSVLATLDITKTVDGDNSSIKIDNLGGEMIFTKYTGDPIHSATHTDHTVIPFSMMTDDTYLKDYQRIYNKYVGVLESMGTDLNITPLPE